ncbi:hypothetical protein ACFV85_14950 [Streptomyces niveus]|uniref:hypothetical protein n=1 Tax=Streptomyces niveus TaxID=193462 RepID=UPI00365A6BAC
MDVVYVVEPGDGNEELRYSLRSLAAHLPHDRVWIAGHRPAWVSGDVGHIPTTQQGSRFRNSTGNLRAACEHPDVSEEFAYFNDDFFVMEPADEVPRWHRGPLDAVIASTRSSLYRRGAQATALLMSRMRLDTDGPLLSYEMHAPMVVTKAGMLQALDAGAGLPVLHKRTLYGNMQQLGGDQADDVKVRTLDDGPPDAAFWSTSDAAFTGGRIGVLIRAAFPDPCRYEDGHEDAPAVVLPEGESEPPPAPSETAPASLAERPAVRAPVADWRAYADAQDPADHSGMTKSELIEQYGG